MAAILIKRSTLRLSNPNSWANMTISPLFGILGQPHGDPELAELELELPAEDEADEPDPAPDDAELELPDEADEPDPTTGKLPLDALKDFHYYYYYLFSKKEKLFLPYIWIQGGKQFQRKLLLNSF